MKKTKKILALVLFTFFMFSNISFAASLEITPEQEARYIAIAAATCLSSYSNRVADIFFDHQDDFGWDATGYTAQTATAEAHFIVSFRYDAELDRNIYLVSFRGSESKKDWKLNLQTSKVNYGGTTPEEFEQVANTKDTNDKSVPMVHKGFHKYVQTAFSIKISSPHGGDTKLLSDILREDPKAFLLTTGHSLGGAAATLFAARLVDMGIDQKKIAVISFGAPAVGNQAFADKIKDTIILLRVVNKQDLVPSSLNNFLGDYVHFGEELVFKTDLKRSSLLDLHSNNLYFTLAIKNYFDKFHAAVLNGTIKPFATEVRNSTAPHVAVCTILAPELAKHPDAHYITAVMGEQYQNFFPSYTLFPTQTSEAKKNFDFAKVLSEAKSVNADYALFVKLAARKLPTSKEEKIIVVLEATFYNVNTGQLESYSTYTTSLNTDINILESVIIESMKIKNDLDHTHSWLNKSF